MKLHEIRRARRVAMLARGQKPDGLDDYFVGIVQQFRPYLLALAFSILRNRDRAEDAVSEAFYKAYIHLHGFAPEEREQLKAKAWLGEITRNLCIDYQNKEKEESLDGLTEAGYQIVAHPYQSPENAVFYADAVALISKSLAALSLREREIVRCYVMESQCAADVAKMLGISRATVYVTAQRAIVKLRHPQLSRPLIVRIEGIAQGGLVLDA